MTKISIQDEKSVKDIANYINKHFASREDKVRAIFSWLARNISYDVENRFEGIRYTHIDEVINKTIKTRKALCFGYAETFKAIAAQTGVEVRVISGYTRQQGKIDQLPHSWCAVRMNGNKWTMVDPTWGAGYVTGDNYYRKINDQWLMIAPEKLVGSHMPFDPLWQFSYYPITNKKFMDNKGYRDTLGRPYFNFPDSIRTYDKLSLQEQLKASNRRISGNGVINQHIANQIKRNQQQIDFLQLDEQTDLFNRAVNSFNEGVRHYNAAIDLKNKNDRRLDDQIKQKTLQARDTLQNSLDELNKIAPSSKLAPSVKDLKKSIEELMNKIM